MAGLKKKNMEFIQASRRGTAGGKRIPAVAAGGLLSAALILAVGGRGIWQWNQIRRLQRETEEIEVYINREDIRESSEKASELHGEMKLMADYLSNMKKARAILDSYPRMDKKTADLLTDPAEAAIEEVRFENGVLKLTAAVSDYREAAPYIKILEESGKFEAVVYEGFEHTDLYRFRVSCKIKTEYAQPERRENKGDS